MESKYSNDRIAFRTQTGVSVLNIDSIIYCKGEGRYTYIYLNNNKHIVVAKLLKDVELVLPLDIFYRIHKSCLINLDYVKELNILKEKTIILKDDTRLKLACRRQPMFFKKLLSNVTIV
ncbi:MAG: LytTR family transcriptional regulator DNA-binding domain-containing protein [Bacteroidales bacterium]|nr:LytTR family transcriptional regulator DNA-binding domain-containing protein [Bacteroidales bacterium]